MITHVHIIDASHGIAVAISAQGTIMARDRYGWRLLGYRKPNGELGYGGGGLAGHLMESAIQAAEQSYVAERYRETMGDDFIEPADREEGDPA